MNNIDRKDEKYLTYGSVSGFVFTSSLGTVFTARVPKIIKD
jgi:hypothetical protein